MNRFTQHEMTLEEYKRHVELNKMKTEFKSPDRYETISIEFKVPIEGETNGGVEFDRCRDLVIEYAKSKEFYYKSVLDANPEYWKDYETKTD